MNERYLRIAVEYFLMIVCAVVGIQTRGGLVTAFDWLVPKPDPYLIAAGFLGILNTGHFIWGIFYTDPDISDIPTQGLMTSYFDLQRIGIRILAFITIGPSVYLRQAINLSRPADEDA
jgi:hypothetical protein